MMFLYRCFTWAYALPLALFILLRSPFRRDRQTERLGMGLVKISGEQRSIWLVASSVGEVTIALKLIRRLKGATSQPVVLTVTTPTGRDRAAAASPQPDLLYYHPLDVKTLVDRFLNALRPAVVVLIETELWPQLIESALESGIRVVQVSGRISPRSFPRYSALAPLFRPLLRHCKLLMQSEDDRNRMVSLTAGNAQIAVLGSVKEEYDPPEPSQLELVRNRLAAWKRCQVWVCGSTRPGEEAAILNIYLQLRKRFADLRLILAPRHLERLDEVRELVHSSGAQCALWNQDALRMDSSVLVIDAMGLLNAIYHCGNLAFVGGTLVPVGGHNLLEPAFAGLPTIYGKHYHQQESAHRLLVKFKMNIVVEDEGGLERAVEELLLNPDKLAQFRARAEALREWGESVTRRYVERILQG